MTVRRIYKRADLVQDKEKGRRDMRIFRDFLTKYCAKYAFYKRVRIPTITLDLCNKYQYNMCINLIICSLDFFQEIVPNSAWRLYFAYIPHEMHEDLLSRQQ